MAAAVTRAEGGDYGLDKPTDGDLNANDRSKNQLIGGNVWYNFYPELAVAVEYSNIATSYKDASKAVDDRIDAGSITTFAVANGYFPPL